ncbi:MAG: hypothetical protein FWC50_06810 [Planctomycetaceae bacterium]|nr:hypothetical protein [Planctomycetaceae bacterium]
MSSIKNTYDIIVIGFGLGGMRIVNNKYPLGGTCYHIVLEIKNERIR